jgi:hypothetical protein
MRLLGLVAAAVFVVPVALFAQHSTAAPTPSIAAPIAVHISSPPPPAAAGIHSFNTTPAHSPGVTSPAGTGIHELARTSSKVSGQRASDHGSSASSANSQSAKPGIFAFLHRHKPIKRNAGAPTPSTTLIHPAVAPLASEKNVGCTVVAVPNPGIPCNMYSPCCPPN